jgi:hypothetical protein
MLHPGGAFCSRPVPSPSGLELQVAKHFLYVLGVCSNPSSARLSGIRGSDLDAGISPCCCRGYHNIVFSFILSRFPPFHVFPHSAIPATTQNPQFHRVALTTSSTFNTPTPRSINFAQTLSRMLMGQAGVSQYLLFRPLSSAA